MALTLFVNSAAIGSGDIEKFVYIPPPCQCFGGSLIAHSPKVVSKSNPHRCHVMKSILLQFLSLYTAALAVLGKTNPIQQELLVREDGMVQQDKVPGHNDAIYDIVPKEDQILKIEFLEVAPTPILA